MRKLSYRTFIYLFVFFALLALLIFQIYYCRYIYGLRNPYLIESLPNQSSMLYGSLSKSVLKTSLVPDKPSLVVHYLWCRKGHFEFKHFTSIVSIYTVIRPDKIVFHYWELPVKDDQGFITWFDDIQRDIPILVLQYVSQRRFCSHRYFESTYFDIGEYHNPNGIFISEDIAIDSFTRELYFKYLGDQKCSDQPSREKVCYSNKDDKGLGKVFIFPESEPVIVSEHSKSLVIKCPSIHDFNTINDGPRYMCVQITDRIFPRDIWKSRGRFSALARSIVYGSEKEIVPVQSANDQVPLYAHILHFNQKGIFGLTAYSSIMSSLYKAGMTHVFLHGDEKPSGSMWKKILKHNVSYVPVRFLEEWNNEHADLLYGLYILMHYGGILFRSNTVWQKQIPPTLLTFTTVATLRRSIYRIINPSIDLNIIISMKHSPFVQTLLAELRQTPTKHRRYKMEDIAYRTYQSVPESVQTESSLIQHAKCKDQICRPMAEDVDASGALAVQMDWNGKTELSTREQTENSRGPGTDVVKEMINLI